MHKNHRILVCPLNWGLGHASRDVYLVNRLLERNYEVIIGGEGPALEFLQNEFPGLTSVYLPSYKIRFSHHYPAWLMITLLLPNIISRIIRENKLLQKVIREYQINLVISDTRYGLWSRVIPSIFITHQISFTPPSLLRPLQYLIYRINLAAINRFSRCWIPDFPGFPNLSGDLSHRYRLPAHSTFIGPLSRFIKIQSENIPVKGFEVAVILSGPEPQRSVFEKIITNQLILSERKSIIVRGKTSINITENLTDKCMRISCLKGSELLAVLKSSKYIISRSGYSTIMDLVILKKTALLVPTPGQTEQEYLARYLEEQDLFLYTGQKEFNLKEAMNRLDKFSPKILHGEKFVLLDRAMDELYMLLKEKHCC